ncbi:Histone H2A [Vitis vinifera]|nr:Histone H2A [Vitis vinifera]
MVGGRKGGGPKKKHISHSVKTSLQFLVGRIGRCLKKGRHSQHVGIDVIVYIAVVLEWLLISELQLKVYCLHWKR